jgi:murein DD-endopeptidase MepM/ murein hydrolase activator NlpD
MGRAVRVAIVLTLLLVLKGVSPGRVLGVTVTYTLPFFDDTIGVTQPYGCTAYSNERNWSGTNADGTLYSCTSSTSCTGHSSGCDWFHKGIDYGTGSNLDLAATAAGTVTYVYNASSGSTCGTVSTGNHVIIKHDSTHYSLYYHLTQNTITVSVGDSVSAGQKIGKSGNTGNSCGAHLHYELMTCSCSNTNPEQTYQPNGKWTTATGEVPWLAHYFDESSTGTQDICYGFTSTHWVKFTNFGGRTWSNTSDANGKGRILFVSVASAGSPSAPSQFQASDWEDSARTGGFDQSLVSPGGIGTFTFGLLGNGTVGNTYTVHFNLAANSLRWFDYDSLGDYYLHVYILPHSAC